MGNPRQWIVRAALCVAPFLFSSCFEMTGYEVKDQRLASEMEANLPTPTPVPNAPATPTPTPLPPPTATPVTIVPPSGVQFTSSTDASLLACKPIVVRPVATVNGATVPVTATDPINLTFTGVTAAEVFTDPGCATPDSSPIRRTIASGGDSAAIYLKAATAGSRTINVAAAVGTGSLTGDSQTLTIAIVASSVALSDQSGSLQVGAGVCSTQDFRANVKSADGAAFTLPAGVTISIVLAAKLDNGSASDAKFYSDNGCSLPLPGNQLTINPNNSYAHFRIKNDKLPQHFTVTATIVAQPPTGPITTGTLVLDTVSAVAELAFTGGPTSWGASVCSSPPLKLRTQDVNHNPVNVPAAGPAITATITVTVGTGALYSDANCSVPASSVTVLGGQGVSGPIYFKPADSNPFVLHASALGLSRTVDYSGQGQLVVSNTAIVGPSDGTATVCSKALTLRTQDYMGNPKAPAAGTTIQLSGLVQGGVTVAKVFTDPTCDPLSELANGIMTLPLDPTSPAAGSFYVQTIVPATQVTLTLTVDSVLPTTMAHVSSYARAVLGFDPSFDTANPGRVIFSGGAGTTDVLRGAAPHGNDLVATGTVADASGNETLAVARVTRVGQPDLTFTPAGGGASPGVVTFGLGTRSAGNAIAVQQTSNGPRLLVAGRMANTTQDFVLLRINPSAGNVAIDTAAVNGVVFGDAATPGRAVLDFAGGTDEAVAIAFQGSDIVVAGTTVAKDAQGNVTGSDFAVAKYDRDGKLLWQTTADFGGQLDELRGLAINGDRIYLVGRTTPKATGSHDSFAVACLTSAPVFCTEVLDTGFGAGRVVTDFMAGAIANGVALHGTDGIVAVGQTVLAPAGASFSTGTNVAVARYRLPSFGLDPNFGQGGTNVFDTSTMGTQRDEVANAVIVSSDGHIFAGGTMTASGVSQWMVMRLTSNGVLDNAANDAIRAFGYGSAATTVRAMFFDALGLGKLLLFGTGGGGTAGDQPDFAVTQLTQ